MKKYRGGEKEKNKQDEEKQEFSVATSAMTATAPKKSRRKGGGARLDEGQEVNFGSLEWASLTLCAWRRFLWLAVFPYG